MQMPQNLQELLLLRAGVALLLFLPTALKILAQNLLLALPPLNLVAHLRAE
jgi:hypothetical protein